MHLRYLRQESLEFFVLWKRSTDESKKTKYKKILMQCLLFVLTPEKIPIEDKKRNLDTFDDGDPTYL